VRSFQYALSLRLAREHPEITERLAEEMMQRNLQDRQLTARQQFLMCMRPWFDNLSFVKLRESDVIARLLQSLYYVTLRNNDAYPAVMETLWSAIASKVRPITFRARVCVSLAQRHEIGQARYVASETEASVGATMSAATALTGGLVIGGPISTATTTLTCLGRCHNPCVRDETHAEGWNPFFDQFRCRTCPPCSTFSSPRAWRSTPPPPTWRFTWAWPGLSRCF